MAKTYGELVLEYQNYQHSDECHKLTKECYEVDLVNSYLESQQFLLENTSEIYNECVDFDRSYFIEASDPDSKDSIKNDNDKKSEGILKKIASGLSKAWTNFKNFWKRLFDKNSKINQAIVKSIEELKGLDLDSLSFDNDAIKELKNILDDCWDQKYKSAGFLLGFNSTYNVDNTIEKICDAIPNKNKELIDLVKAAFTLDKVRITFTTNSKTGKPQYAAGGNTIYEMYSVFYSAAKVKVRELDDGSKIEYIDAYAVYNAIKKLGKIIDEITSSREIAVRVSEKSLEKNINKLQYVDYNKLRYELDTARERIIYTDLNTIYNELNALLGNSMAMYNYIINYRNHTHIALLKLFRKCCMNKKDQ